jgi:hypothetical protein
MKGVRMHHEPELTDPWLVAAWPGVGNVALIAATYLKDKLEAEEFAEIDPCGFFEPGGVFIKDNVIETPEFPSSKFHFWKRGDAGPDLVIFVSEAQPATKAHEYANMVLDVAVKLGIRRVCTLAAALTEHHPDKPRVLGAATSAALHDELRKCGAVLTGDFYVAGLNGILAGAAKAKGLEGMCLLGETAKYTAKIANPTASKAVLGVLTRLLDIEIDMAELEELAASTERQIKEIGDEMRREFLQHFTKPIWERDEETENG